MIFYRPRRNRKTQAIRSLVQETHLSPCDLIYPQFIIEGENRKSPIESMPPLFRLSEDLLLKEVESLLKQGISSIILFPVISKERKDPKGSEALNPKGLLPKVIYKLKQTFPSLCVIADVALDPYTSHGHDGIVDAEGEVQNDATVALLVQQALLQAEAGADMIAPSDMMDGRVGEIRRALDKEGFTQVSIHAYAAKYASAFYSPFRQALSSAPSFGNKKSYQMHPGNVREALREVFLDEEEGADIIMIKPALPYLDVITKVRESTHLPISAYQVSGEYSMIMAAAQKGWVNEDEAFFESLLAIKRAGADMILTYAAVKISQLLTSGALD